MYILGVFTGLAICFFVVYLETFLLKRKNKTIIQYAQEKTLPKKEAQIIEPKTVEQEEFENWATGQYEQTLEED